MKAIVKIFLFTLLTIFFCKKDYSQNLNKVKLSGKDLKLNVQALYEYEGTNHYQRIKLHLFKDGTFKYALKDFYKNVFSEGKWTKKDDVLFLNSGISNDNVPIKLTYSDDTTGTTNSFIIAAVRNQKGEIMRDGLININSDTIECDPGLGICTGEYQSIDSIKVYFENGLRSGWIKVENKKYKQLIPVVQTPFLMSSYISFSNFRYKILKNHLQPID